MTSLRPRSFIERGALAIPLQDRVFQLWWHILLSPQAEWAWGATTGHATANYPSETWRESLSCSTHVHTESTDTFNESKEVLLAFTLLLNLIWILKKMEKPHFLLGGSISDWRVHGFSCSLTLFRFVHSDAQTHFIVSFVCCYAAVAWFGICERTQAINEIAGNGTCLVSARLLNSTPDRT